MNQSPAPAACLYTVENASAEVVARAAELARRFGLALRPATAIDEHSEGFGLILTAERLELRDLAAWRESRVGQAGGSKIAIGDDEGRYIRRPPAAASHSREGLRGQERIGAVYADFVHGPTALRRASGASRKQPIARAVGVREPPPSVFDATAGLGRDAFLLACLGCRVTAVERSPVLAALLWDGLDRAAKSGNAALCSVVARLTPVIGDARELLARSVPLEAPDVVYLDPMYPEEKKSALSGKELRVCRAVVGDDPDAAELLQIAREVAGQRTVVKRHRHAPPLEGAPEISFSGRSVRYDVYLSKRRK